MSEELVLGIDIGTASSKAVLATPAGEIVASAQRPHGLSMPRPGWFEHDAETIWWDDLLALCSQLLPGVTGLKAVCVSGIGPCLLPCDANLRPLRPAILYGIDRRASAEIEELDTELGAQAILARCGSLLSSQALGPKLLWFRRREPELWARARGWYMAHSFAVARLTGEYVLDHHSASQCAPLYDLDQASWAEDWAAAICGELARPRLVWPAEVVGAVSEAAAAQTGIPAGTPVAGGTIDAWAEAWSAGVHRPGDRMIMYGSTMFFVQVVEGSPRAPDLWCTNGVGEGTRTLAAGMFTAGTLTTWVRSLVGSPPWEELVAEAASLPPGSGGLLMLPYFAGERTPVFDPESRGAVVGLTLGHGRGHLLRAADQGIAFGTRQILELFDAADLRARRTVAVGGGLHARLWPQIVSDVTGLAQLVPAVGVGASYGDALLAAEAAGLVPAGTDWTRAQETLEPDPASHARYSELYALYHELYPRTRELSHALGAIARQDPPPPAGGVPDSAALQPGPSEHRTARR